MAPPGVPVAALVAKGEADLGFQQLSELIGQPGIEVVGPLPPDSGRNNILGWDIEKVARRRRRPRVRRLSGVRRNSWRKTASRHGAGIKSGWAWETEF